MSEELGLGKVTREVFERSVLPYVPVGEIGLDGATVELTDRTVVAHSPSIGVPVEALGFFAFHYAASNVASRFGRPTHLVTGIYLPLRTRESDLRIIARGLGDEARRYGVKITGGQTATYYGLEIPLVTATCLGESLREPYPPAEGDLVVVVGEVGGEGAWLRELSRGASSDAWRGFTPLPAILSLQGAPHVKLMHDVSEGGVQGALFEIQESCRVKLSIDSKKIRCCGGELEAGDDPLRSPSYGTLIAVINPEGLRDVETRCGEAGYPVSVAGKVERGVGLYVDGVRVEEQERVELDEIYGSLTERDEVTSDLRRAIDSVTEMEGVEDLIPEVGLNMVYSRADPVDAGDVAGLSGRVVRAMGKPLACGEIAYGASRHMASVLLESRRLNPSIRAAVNVRGGEDMPGRLEEIGLRTVVLPQKIEGEGCPTARFIRGAEQLADAYMHPGDYGVEPTTTILAETPWRLTSILGELTRR